MEACRDQFPLLRTVGAVDKPVFTFGPFRLNLAERLLLDAL
jgi:hypothetical protein